jgi:FKBP-type peptidyl-prolyl cis-trans isomerase (trigger factor)
MEGMKKEDIDSKAEEFKKELKKMAERDIKVFFIFDRIAEAENIKPEKQDMMFKKVMEFLMKEAVWEGGSADGQ